MSASLTHRPIVVFESMSTLADRLARDAADAFATALRHRDTASLAVSGGSTPARYLPALAALDIDWSRIAITLTDERWVDVDDARSNEAFVRTHLLTHGARAARFVALKTPHATADAACAAVDRALHAMPQPFDLVLLGMGDDGHIASLFPHSPALAVGLARNTAARCVAVPAPTTAAPHVARMSLTLRALLDARRIVLVIQGDAKRDALEAAWADGDPHAAPVAALFTPDTAERIDVYWTR